MADQVSSGSRRRQGWVFGAAGLAVVLVAAILLVWKATASTPATPHLSVRDAYIPVPASPDVAAVYLTIRNTGGQADALLSARTDAAPEAMMHRDNGTTMIMLTSVPVPAHGQAEFARSDRHIMLDPLRRRLVQGDRVSLTLHFQRSADLTISVPVRPIDYRPNG